MRVQLGCALGFGSLYDWARSVIMLARACTLRRLCVYVGEDACLSACSLRCVFEACAHVRGVVRALALALAHA
jgi:hypothetical protein